MRRDRGSRRDPGRGGPDGSPRTGSSCPTARATRKGCRTSSRRCGSFIGKRPIFGICLGHQIIGLALGGRTYKLKFGHHGGNQPVKDLTTGRVEITAQNHGFAVDMQSFQDASRDAMHGGPEDIVLTHVNLNDHTCEGMMHRRLPLFSVQYHPEASPGPHDAGYLFRAVRGADGSGSGSRPDDRPARPLAADSHGRTNDGFTQRGAVCPSGLTSGRS